MWYIGFNSFPFVGPAGLIVFLGVNPHVLFFFPRNWGEPFLLETLSWFLAGGLPTGPLDFVYRGLSGDCANLLGGQVCPAQPPCPTIEGAI